MHLERADGNPATPDFIPPGYGPSDVTFHNVITEWHADDPRSLRFTGTRRELLRVAHVVQFSSHPIGAVEFNPTAEPGSADYGLLYTSGSDLGFSNGGGPNANNPSATQRLDSLITAILRIDPRSPSVTGGAKGIGDYTVPADNKFQADGDPSTLGEIYAYGFRNAHRLSWDLMDGTLFVGDIGMNHIEEVNIVRNGGNYGWMKREGYWENGMTRPGGALNQLYELPGDVLRGQGRDEFIYPVAVYDHNEGVAITGAYPYHGRIEALRGKLVFGDVNRGRLFAVDLAAAKAADDGIPETVAPIEEIQLYVRGAHGPAHLHVVPRARRGHDGDVAVAHRSALEPQQGRRALSHFAPGRHDPHARAGLRPRSLTPRNPLMAENTDHGREPLCRASQSRRGRAGIVARRRFHSRGARRARRSTAGVGSPTPGPSWGRNGGPSSASSFCFGS